MLERVQENPVLVTNDDVLPEFCCSYGFELITQLNSRIITRLPSVMALEDLCAIIIVHGVLKIHNCLKNQFSMGNWVKIVIVPENICGFTKHINENKNHKC